MRFYAYMQSRRFFLSTILFLGLASAAFSQTLKINGATTVNIVVAEAAEILRAKNGQAIEVDTQGGSSGGISMVGEGKVDLGMVSKHVSDDDRKKYPGVDFKETHIGADAVALIVSKDVWESGVQSVTREQVKGIYEGKIKNWQEVGANRSLRIAFLNKEPGRGTWENFAKWVYGDSKLAPIVSFPEVGGNEETRQKVATTRGALSQLSSSWADGERVFALGIKGEDGKVVYPTNENVINKSYPMSRPLSMLSNGEPKGQAAEFIKFLLGAEGQKLVEKHGYVAIAAQGE